MTAWKGAIMDAKERIIEQLKRSGCRVTKQRLMLIDVILEGKCNCCKEIYYQASLKDPSIGPATVYRMVNTLTDIGVLKVATLKPQTALGSGSGAISRKNMYRISDDGNKMECMVELEDGTVLDLPEDKWTAVIKSGLDACGFSGGQNVRNITLKEA